MEHTFAAAAAMLLVVALAVFGFFLLSGFYENKEEAFAAEQSAEVFEEPESEKMVLGVFEGKLALFIGESPYPNRIYDFLTRTLPPEDRKSLEEGIEIKSEEELEVLLEDYMS